MGDGATDLPRIHVVNFHGFWFSLDHRRLAALQHAFGMDQQVEVWEKPFAGQAKKEFYRKFTTGFASVPVRAGDGIYDAHSAFTARLCTKSELADAKEQCRLQFEEQISSLVAQRDATMAQFDELQVRLQEQPDDDQVVDDVMDVFSKVCALDLRELHSSLSEPCSSCQLNRILALLVESGRLCTRPGPRGELLYTSPDAPHAHPQISVQRQEGSVWTLTSSAATRQHALLDGRSLAVKHAYVGCTLFPLDRGPAASAIVELRGTWAKGDKLLIGMWPLEGLEVSQCYSCPGAPESGGESQLPVVRGHWVSCTSGRWLTPDQQLAPVDWSPPAKAEGVRWGVRLSSSVEMEVSCAEVGQELRWGGRRWFNNPAPLVNPEMLRPAILVQPHQRSDSSTAELRILEAV